MSTLLLMLVNSCSAPATPASSTPTRAALARQTPTPAPTQALTPTRTPEIVATAAITSSPVPTRFNPGAGGVVLPSPGDPPLSTWNGITIMPNAIAGNNDGTLYTFSVKATLMEVQSYYVKEMSAAGWTLRDSLHVQSDPNYLMLLFTRSDALSVSVLAHVQGDVTLVMIVS